MAFHNKHPADSSDYNGHSTVAETLFVGLPCVTQPGDMRFITYDVIRISMTSVTSGISMASRVAASLLLLGSTVSVGVVLLGNSKICSHARITRDSCNIVRY